jgi:hypothetical protein
MDPVRVTMGLAHDAANGCTEPWYSRGRLDFQRDRGQSGGWQIVAFLGAVKF